MEGDKDLCNTGGRVIGNTIKGLEECERLHKKRKIYNTQVLEPWEKTQVRR